MNENQYMEVMGRLGEIGGDVKAMHRRQDISNGRTAKNEERIIDLEKATTKLIDGVESLKDRNEEKDKAQKEKEENAKDNRTYFTRLVAERIMWIVIAIITAVLAKTGIINLNI